MPNLGCRGAESPGCFTKKLCWRCDAWAGMLSWWSCQWPVAHSFGLLNHLNSFCRAILKLNEKSDADSLPYSLSHFECDSHTVHMLTQQRLLPPLTSTVKSSLLPHTHSSPLSLAARLHWCHANCSHCINNGWIFSRQTSKLLELISYLLHVKTNLSHWKVFFNNIKIGRDERNFWSDD